MTELIILVMISLERSMNVWINDESISMSIFNSSITLNFYAKFCNLKGYFKNVLSNNKEKTQRLVSLYLPCFKSLEG